MVDKPVRLVSIFYGEDHRTATVWQDLKTRQYIVERKSPSSDGYNTESDNACDAEASAEDWVLKQ